MELAAQESFEDAIEHVRAMALIKKLADEGKDIPQGLLDRMIRLKALTEGVPPIPPVKKRVGRPTIPQEGPPTWDEQLDSKINEINARGAKAAPKREPPPTKAIIPKTAAERALPINFKPPQGGIRDDFVKRVDQPKAPLSESGRPLGMHDHGAVGQLAHDLMQKMLWPLLKISAIQEGKRLRKPFTADEAARNVRRHTDPQRVTS